MSKKKTYKAPGKPLKAEVPVAEYGKKRIAFFNSFEEQELEQLKKMAKQTPSESLAKLEQLRLFFFKEHLLPDGSWSSLKKTITIKSPFL